MTTADYGTTVDRIEGRLSAGLARSGAEIEAAQALRFRVFATELGATLRTPRPGHDVDAFDPYCRHLVVRDRISQQVVACTRILEGWQAARAGGFYSAGEFHMEAIDALPGRKLEIGRTCVDPEYRAGPALALLWSALAGFVRHHRYDYLIGCASVSARDQGAAALAVMRQLQGSQLAPATLQVRPRVPLPAHPGAAAAAAASELPSLIRAYLSLGARVCGDPCLDPDFQVADLFLLLDLRHLDARFARRFLHPTGHRPIAA